MTKDQGHPLSPDEYILRRVPASPGNKLINLDLPRPLDRTAFRPNKNDIFGISVFRELFVTPLRIAKKGRKGPNSYYVVRLRVSDVRAAGFNAIPDPQTDQLPGHTLIPEINLGTDKERSKELQLKLANLVTLNDIVFKPGQHKLLARLGLLFRKLTSF